MHEIVDFVASYSANEDNADTGSTVLAIETHHGKIPKDALFLLLICMTRILIHYYIQLGD